MLCWTSGKSRDYFFFKKAENLSFSFMFSVFASHLKAKAEFPFLR